MRILIAEDDVDIASILKSVLVKECFAVDVVHTGKEAYKLLSEDDYDLLLLDLMMPFISGEELLNQLRKDEKDLPTIVITAKESVDKKVEVLDMGADDYISKPFDFDELLARVRAVVRRSTKTKPVLSVSDLTLDPSSLVVKREGKKIDLTAKEFALLEFLLQNKGNILKETQIISHVWDREYDGLSNIVAVYIRYLRTKIDKPFPHLKSLIKTVKGLGYMITE